MALTSPKHVSSSGAVAVTTKRLATGLYVSVTTVVALCAKKASQVSRKLKTTPPSGLKFLPKSPLKQPKRLLTAMSSKAMMMVRRKRVGEENEEFGDGGVWQRAILMGDKCQPLDFSGVIYYDENGKQLDEVPVRSPRASPLPGYLAKRGP